MITTFNEYQVAPHLAGEQSVFVPYSELKSIVAPGGALARLAR